MTHVLSDFRVDGLTAVVTGGAGLLGSQFTRTLTNAGARVVCFDKKKPRSDATEYVLLDITDEQAVKAAMRDVAGEDRLSILVNCAGIDTPPDAPVSDNGLFEDYSTETFDAVLASHLKGAFLASREFFRNCERQGSIVNISSIYGVVSPDQSVYQYRRDRGEEFYKPVAYTVAKAGMIGLTKWLAEYGGLRGIRANTLVLGGVFADQEKEFVDEYTRRTPLGRMAIPNDYNGALLFLASSASSYMTGAELVIDGGWTAR